MRTLVLAVVLLAGCGNGGGGGGGGGGGESDGGESDLAVVSDLAEQPSADMAGADLKSVADLAQQQPGDMAQAPDMAQQVTPTQCLSQSCDAAHPCKTGTTCSGNVCVLVACNSMNNPCVAMGLTCINNVCQGGAGDSCDSCSRLCFTGGGGFCGGDGKCH